jgi:hypothetical protein
MAGCTNSLAQQPVDMQAEFKGHYIYTGAGPLPDGRLLFDGGTWDADGQGHALQCGGPSYGAQTDRMNCATTYTVRFGVSDDGVPMPYRFGLADSNVGDHATIACTEHAKVCVVTSHNVGWAWTIRLEKE